MIRSTITRLLKLKDVNPAGFANGQTPVWNSATGKFDPGNAAGGGAGIAPCTGYELELESATLPMVDSGGYRTLAPVLVPFTPESTVTGPNDDLVFDEETGLLSWTVGGMYWLSVFVSITQNPDGPTGLVPSIGVTGLYSDSESIPNPGAWDPSQGDLSWSFNRFVLLRPGETGTPPLVFISYDDPAPTNWDINIDYIDIILAKA
jgi:hypothetical protein